VCSCSPCIAVLTPTPLCCPALLRPHSALRLHSTPALLHPRAEGVQQTTQLITQHGRARLLVLPMHVQQTRPLLSPLLQPKSAAEHRPSQLSFREQLMHELLAQLPAEQKPHRARARPDPADSPAKDHYSVLSEQQRDCVVCSAASASRKRIRYICAECGVHLCIGECFSRYHA